MIATEQNPLLEGLMIRRRPPPCVLVIFGASGDLTQRKLMPALYSLAYRRLLPERFAIVGAARSRETTVRVSNREGLYRTSTASPTFRRHVEKRPPPGCAGGHGPCTGG